jgi:hypothetical protein
MGAIIAVAPPVGWRRWPRAKYHRWHARYGVDGRRIGTNSEYVLFRLTVLFRLDDPAARTKRYPLFYRLHFGRNELLPAEVKRYLEELSEIERRLGGLGLDAIVSPDSYLDRLNFDLPERAFRRQKTGLWSRLVSGRLPIGGLSPKDLDFYLGMLRWAFPKKSFNTCRDFFHYVFRDHRLIARRALKKRRGLLLNL